MGFDTERLSILVGLVGAGVSLLTFGSAPAGAHDISQTIDNCACDQACYTDEVSDVACADGYAVLHSHGLPDPSHDLMTGIIASNQQFPQIHNHEIRILLAPQMADTPTPTAEGAIGIAVNGVPIFSPDTQGPVQADTGRPVSAAEAGELDACGGHAGRGDDYHYHVAPNCLIEELGAAYVEAGRKPIGFAMDGFPILALGWFDAANDIEDELDACRGIYDADSQYFYNVQHEGNWDVLNCFVGSVQKNFGHDEWEPRIDLAGDEMVGSPIGFHIEEYKFLTEGDDVCHVMTGTLHDLQVLQTDQSVAKIDDEQGTLFYCNPGCYGQFFEADDIAGVPGRTMYFERPVSDCPAVLGLASLPMFTPYEGPAQTRKGPPTIGE